MKLGTSWPPSWERPTGVRERTLARLVTMPPIAAAVMIAAALAVCWGLVWVTGGSQRAFSHTFYVPIVLAAVRFGLRGTLVTSAAAATLAGPLMPLDTTTGEAQAPHAWIVRAVMFLAVGTLVTFAFEARRRAAERQLARDVRETLTPFVVRQVDAALVPLVDGVLADNTFHTVFQPIYALHSGRLLGVEALTRVDVAPYRPPDAWFAAARATGRGTELELAVVVHALGEAQALPDGIDLALNVSPTTLADPQLVDLLRDAGRPVTIEITEHAGVEDYDLLSHRIDELRGAGIRIAVDDAGAGIASLQHIVQLAPHVIKLDISLTQGVAASPLRRALAGSLIEFAQQTGAQLLVEGIEDDDDLETWTALGAHACQGFLVGRPSGLPVPAVSHAITRHRTTLARRPA
ncbi:EAL domain-containing protein [Actinotalea sp. M2MS4P-6]|uniref:EAL domain-containing protein n=1 Tax=Actinotalea sp. M2MS4P-6 TaxID=2983762 RepID=UPI0021E4CA50|nr:EAL domain-containing protein [Actinotalea sp. M2MS4P-6]MCV2395263.1 EAL domain-containing protein [Actinotalea sp. M2MS4P-6]